MATWMAPSGARSVTAVRFIASGPVRTTNMAAWSITAERWAFWYDPLGDEGEEPIFRFDRHRFAEGEYLSITEHDGVATDLPRDRIGSGSVRRGGQRRCC